MSLRPIARAGATAAIPVLVAGLLVTGCSEDPEPRFSDPTDAPGSSSPTEQETSEDAQPQTAEEFIREWVELDTEMQNTGDADEYLAVSDSCAPCTSVASRVGKIFADGGYIETKGWQIRDIRPVARGSRFRLVGRATTVTIVEREGAKEQRLDGGPITYDFVLHRSAEGWQVRDLLEVAT